MSVYDSDFGITGTKNCCSLYLHNPEQQYNKR